MFFRTYGVAALALVGLGFAVYTVKSQQTPVALSEPIAQPAGSPFQRVVAGAGLIEASTQNIAVGAHIAGVVATVHVSVGQVVKRGDPLFTIDDRTLRAELAVRTAALLTAQRELERLRSQPRPEDVPPAEARVAEARVQVEDLSDQLAKRRAAGERAAASEDEIARRSFQLAAAEKRLAESRAELERIKAGAWAADLEVAQALVSAASAQVEAAQTEIDRLTVRAPVDGSILQVNIRAGEFAQAGLMSTPLIVMGDVSTLHVRVDIDENDAWRVRPDARASASLRGNRELKTELTFVRIEPLVIPKRSLTGESTERVDTRVLQVVYAFPSSALPAYVGQQMDVFIDASDADGAKPSAADAR